MTRHLLCASAVLLALPTVAQVAPDADVPTESPEVKAALAAQAEAARQRAARLRPPAWYVDARASARTTDARATITVNTLAGDNDGTCGTDGGDPIDDCSLLEALDLANSDPAPDVVVFSVTGTIAPDDNPVITTPVTVDGTAGGNTAGDVMIREPDVIGSTQPLRISGAAASGSVVRGITLLLTNLGLRVDGAAGVGIYDNTLRDYTGFNEGSGISIVDSPQAVVGQAGGGNRFRGGFVAVSVSENSPQTIIQGNTIENYTFGIYTSESSQLTIGGSDAGNGNTITNARFGIAIRGNGSAPGVLVIGNTIEGTDGPNAETGVDVSRAPQAVVGGSTPGSANRISGFEVGIAVSGSASLGCTVLGNEITRVSLSGISLENAVGCTVGGAADGEGNRVVDARYGVSLVDVSATRVLGNTLIADGDPATEDYGVSVLGLTDNEVGAPGAGNAISGYTYGVYLNRTTQTAVRGNTIEGDGNPATEDYGVYIRRNSVENVVGGDAPGDGNAISGVAYGVAVVTKNDVRHAILGTTISADVLGIDLGDNGVTPNDPDDGDDGPNDLQNFPVVFEATSAERVGFTLESTPNTTFRIEAFASDQPGPTGYGDGERYLGAAEVTTDGDGQAEGFVATPGLIAGEWVSTTATPTGVASPTGFGGTSEFSLAVQAFDPPSPPQPGPVFTVTTLDGSDDGLCGDGSDPNSDCSLLEAIAASNAAPDENTIQFSVTGTIELSTAATITTPVTIDGTANGRSAGDIVIDGSNATGPASLVVTGEGASGSVVRGLAIVASDVGLRIDEDAANVGVYGNYFGTTPAGSDLGNAVGVLVRRAPDASIGGADPGDGNVLSWNDTGIVVSGGTATGTTIQGNVISGAAFATDDVGITLDRAQQTVIRGAADGAANVMSNLNDGVQFINDATQNAVLGNRISASNGVRIEDAPENVVGGAGAGEGNEIEASRGGVALLGSSSEGNVVLGNRITGVGDAADGIAIRDAPHSTVGGAAAGAGNVISNARYGVVVDGVETAVLGNRITGTSIPQRSLSGIRITASDSEIGRAGAGNQISGYRYGIEVSGTDVQGTAVLANTITDTNRAVVVDRASETTVGGPGAGEGNRIADNDVGVVITGAGATANALLGNAISDNDGLGIDLGIDGVTPNDAGDADVGPNGFQNFPVLAEATAADGVAFSLDTTPNTTLRVEAFANAEPDPTGYGEGARFLGFVEVTTDASGQASGTVPTPGLAVGEWATATATPILGPAALGGTSEFSRAVEATAADDTDVPVSFVVAALSASEAEGSVDLEIRVAGPLDTPATVTVSLVAGNPADLGGFTSTAIDVAAASGERRYPLSIPITDDVLAEGDETFVFELSVSDESPLVVAAPSRAELTVTDNDGGGGGGGGGGSAVTVTVPASAGPFLFASPVDGLSYGSLAAGGQTLVFAYDPATNGFVEVGAGYTFDRGEPVLIAGAGGDLALTGTRGPEVLAVPTGTGADGPVLALVGNPTGVPIPLSAITVEGGALTDVVLVFDAEAGAFRPVSLAGLAADLVLGPFDVVVLQITPDGDADGVEVSLDTDVPYTVGTSLADAPFVPLDDEAAVVLALSSAGAGIADTAVLRFGVGDVGLDPYDGLDVESPVGPTLALLGPTWTDAGAARAPFAALSGWDLESGPVTVPLVVSAPAAGAYELALASEPGAIGPRPILVEVIDGTSETRLETGTPYAFQVRSGDTLEGRFAVRLSLGGAVATSDGPAAFSVTTYPNPARHAAHVAVTVAEAGPLSVVLFDALGREVGRIERAVAAGPTQVDLPVTGLSPGVYVVRVDGPGGAATRRLTVAR